MGVAEIKVELKQEFPSLAQQANRLEQCAEIGALLEEGAKSVKVDNALKLLDQRMYELVHSRIKQAAFAQAEKAPEYSNKSQSEIHRAVIDNLATAVGAFEPKQKRQDLVNQLKPFTDGDPFSKVLTPVLDEFERDCAYPENRDENFHPRYYYVGFVQRENFLDNIKNGYHWKDVGASALHGEFTHRIQWYVIAASGVIPKVQVGEVYRFIGQFRDESKDADSIGQKDIWPRLCDRPRLEISKGKPGDTTSKDDFRAPEHFNFYLIGKDGKNKYPILSSFLDGRFGKRMAVSGETDFPSEEAMQQYIARKLFDKPLGELNQPEKERVAGLTSGPKASDKPNMFVKRPVRK